MGAGLEEDGGRWEEGLGGEGSDTLYHRHKGPKETLEDSRSPCVELELAAMWTTVPTSLGCRAPRGEACAWGPVGVQGCWEHLRAGLPTVELQPDAPDALLLRLHVQHCEMLVVGGHHADVRLRQGWRARAG